MGPQISEDATIGEMWEDALEEFERLAPGKNFKVIALSTTPEELRKKLDTLNENGKGDKNSRSSRAKDIGLKVLEVVKTLGGVAAEVAGMAFGPAEVCFGALSIFLSIPGKVREFHEFIELVFIELDPVLSQFDIYINMEKTHTINDTLRTAIHKVMANFVKLCATVVSIQQGGKWDKFKKHASRVFGDDQELQDELDKFRRIVNGLQNIQVTATYQGVVETREGVLQVQRSVDIVGAGVYEVQTSVDGVGSNVKKLVDDQTKRNREDKKKDWLTAIRKNLGIEDDNISPKPRQEKMLGDRLKDTGNWLLKDDRFKKWADRHHSEADSVLFLTGDPSFGKSSLLSAVIDHLREQASTLDQDRRSLISFHLLPLQKDKSVNQENAAETALKWIAYQLAEQDDALCKGLALLLPNHVDEIKACGFSRLWKLLKIGAPSPRTTNYIIFDDVDKFSNPARQQLTKILAETSDREGDQCSVKILVCGNFDPADMSGGQVKESSVINIGLDIMRDDFRTYINKQLQELNMLPGQECADLRQKLEEKMLTTPGCSFRTIDIAMKGIGRAIATSENEDDIFQAVDRSTQDEDDVMKDTLAQLQAGLRPSQIKLINEILIWVVFGNGMDESDQFDVSPLEAGLRIRGVTLPIGGLANFITREPRGLMHTANLGTTIVLEEGAKKAIVKPREVSRQREPPRISLEIKIVNADLPTARRFFWDLAKYATLDQFDFSTDSTNSQVTTSKGTISVNTVDARLAIVQATLAFLNNSPSSDTEAIGDNLVDNLAQNLRVLYEATDVDAIDHDLKASIGKSIYNLFADPQIIKMHWATFGPHFNLLDAESMSEFWKWLEDKPATSALGTKDKEWLNKCRESDDKTKELLEDVMEMIARLWLEDSDPKPHNYSPYWIQKFLSKAWKDRPKGEAAPEFNSKVDISAAEVWCRKKLKPSGEKMNPLWYEGVARTYAAWGMNGQAILNFKQAVKLAEPNPASWLTMMGLSDALFYASAKEEKELEAAAVKEEGLKIYAGPQGAEIPTIDNKVLQLRIVASWFVYLGKPAKVLEYQKWALELDPKNRLVQYELLKTYIATGQESDAQALLMEVAAGDDEEKGSTVREPGQLVALLNEMGQTELQSSVNSTFWWVVSAATNAGILDRFLKDLEVAIEGSKSPNDPSLYLMLILLRGLVHFYSDPADPGEIKLALESWTEAWRAAEKHHASGNGPQDAFYGKATGLLSKYFFDQAKEKESMLQAGGEVSQLSRSMLENTQKLEQTVADYDQMVLTGSNIESGRCYKAALLAIRGDYAGAKGVFKSDMVQVINMLSDDEQSNDSFALSRLQSILLHSGDYEKAFSGCMMVDPPCIGDRVPGRMRMAVGKLLCPGGQPADNSPTSQILNMFDAEREKDRQPHYIIEDLIEEAGKHMRADRVSASESTTEPIQPEVALVERQTTDVPNSDDLEWGFLHKTLTQLQAKQVLNTDSSQRDCNSCVGIRSNGYDFDNDFYTCKYCYNVNLCEECYHKLKAADPTRMHPVCDPSHDWLYLPKWTIEMWVESVTMVVRLPRKNDQGVLVPGDETMELSEWLNEVTGPWGGLEKGKLWDHVKTPPAMPGDETKFVMGGGDGDEEKDTSAVKDGDEEGQVSTSKEDEREKKIGGEVEDEKGQEISDGYDDEGSSDDADED